MAPQTSIVIVSMMPAKLMSPRGHCSLTLDLSHSSRRFRLRRSGAVGLVIENRCQHKSQPCSFSQGQFWIDCTRVLDQFVEHVARAILVAGPDDTPKSLH